MLVCPNSKTKSVVFNVKTFRKQNKTKKNIEIPHIKLSTNIEEPFVNLMRLRGRLIK